MEGKGRGGGVNRLIPYPIIEIIRTIIIETRGSMLVGTTYIDPIRLL